MNLQDLPTAECRVCARAFIRMNSLAVVCSLTCARRVPVIARNTLRAKVKAERQVDAKRREALQTLPQLRAKAQVAFNAFVRARDAGQPCICCGKYSTGAGSDVGGEYDAGHYRSRGAAPELAFHEDNCHSQLKKCNRRAWDVSSYRTNLLIKIGPARLEALEGPHPARHYTKDDYRQMATEYGARARQLRKESDV